MMNQEEGQGGGQVSLRLEIEQAMGLRFLEKNGEALIRFEESLEVPRGAEALMRGLYRDPDEVKKGFRNLHQETANLLEILMPRRARLKEWFEQLPEQPKEAEKFLRETSEQIQVHDRKVLQLENELIGKLEETKWEDLFPMPMEAFALISYTGPSVKIFLRSLGRLAEVVKINPESLRQVVRIHCLYSLLILAGQDLDGQTYRRDREDGILTALSSFFTIRHIKKQSQELMHSYMEWVNAWGGKKQVRLISQENSLEKVRAAMIFWRRNPSMPWDDSWKVMQTIDTYDNVEAVPKFESPSQYELSYERKFFN